MINGGVNNILNNKKPNCYSYFDYVYSKPLPTLDIQNNFLLYNFIEFSQNSNLENLMSIFTFILDYLVTPIVTITCLFLCIQNLYLRLFSKKFRTNNNTITTLIINLLSYYEVIVMTTSFFFVIVLKLILSVSEDDTSDVVALIILLLIVTLIISFYVSIGTIKSYFLINSNSSGEIKKKLIFNDAVNTFLCLLRIFLCLTRYIFYDLQVELVDMVLNYTEEVNYFTVGDLSNLSFIDVLISKIFDITIFTLSIAICLIKFIISLFLLWLIIDLFILRIGASISED